MSNNGDVEYDGDSWLFSFEEHWVEDLERWFDSGVHAPGLVLIKVHAARIEYWDGEDNEVVTVA